MTTRDGGGVWSTVCQRFRGIEEKERLIETRGSRAAVTIPRAIVNSRQTTTRNRLRERGEERRNALSVPLLQTVAKVNSSELPSLFRLSATELYSTLLQPNFRLSMLLPCRCRICIVASRGTEIPMALVYAQTIAASVEKCKRV